MRRLAGALSFLVALAGISLVGYGIVLTLSSLYLDYIVVASIFGGPMPPAISIGSIIITLFLLPVVFLIAPFWAVVSWGWWSPLLFAATCIAISYGGILVFFSGGFGQSARPTSRSGIPFLVLLISIAAITGASRLSSGQVLPIRLFIGAQGIPNQVPGAKYEEFLKRISSVKQKAVTVEWEADYLVSVGLLRDGSVLLEAYLPTALFRYYKRMASRREKRAKEIVITIRDHDRNGTPDDFTVSGLTKEGWSRFRDGHNAKDIDINGLLKSGDLFPLERLYPGREEHTKDGFTIIRHHKDHDSILRFWYTSIDAFVLRVNGEVIR
jgi:hypothetical protein